MAATRQREGRRSLLDQRSSRASFAAFWVTLLCLGAALVGVAWFGVGAGRVAAFDYSSVSNGPALTVDGAPTPEALVRTGALTGRLFARADGAAEDRGADALDGSNGKGKAGNARDALVSGAGGPAPVLGPAEFTRVSAQLFGAARRAGGAAYEPVPARATVSTRGSRAPPAA
ncbi:MAG: hypothetical protein U0271_10570 [Polyangiaceae bacterium]